MLRTSATRDETIEKYDRLAPNWTEHALADSELYLERRASVLGELAGSAALGDSVLELGCGDGSFGELILAMGADYHGVDASPGMADAARRRLGESAAIDVADMNDYAPAEPVTTTLCFRSIYYVRDRVAFFRHVGSYTLRTLAFDFGPRRLPRRTIESELQEAGYRAFAMRPFLLPTRHALPRAMVPLLDTVERATPLARLLLRFRFSYFCVATVPGGEHVPGRGY